MLKAIKVGRLPQRRVVPVQTEALEGVQDGLRRTGLFARRVDVLNADQPASAVGSRIQP
jgi:hypothetical protein